MATPVSRRTLGLSILPTERTSNEAYRVAWRARQAAGSTVKYITQSGGFQFARAPRARLALIGGPAVPVCYAVFAQARHTIHFAPGLLPWVTPSQHRSVRVPRDGARGRTSSPAHLNSDPPLPTSAQAHRHVAAAFIVPWSTIYRIVRIVASVSFYASVSLSALSPVSTPHAWKSVPVCSLSRTDRFLTWLGTVTLMLAVLAECLVIERLFPILMYEPWAVFRLCVR